MPPQITAFLQSRNGQIAVGAVALVLIATILFFVFRGGGDSNGDTEKLTKDQLELVSVDSVGKAIEIQALLSKKGVRINRESGDGGKQILKFVDGKATQADRDTALLTLVSSGMMDQNVGLALFDKGDLTASREEKRIKLNRAQKEELQRLIRRLGPVQDAQVFLSIPEQTLFTAQKKPMSATVQITPKDPTQRLDRDVVRSVINLMVGAIPDLDSQHVAVTDTNGITYNSVLHESAELGEKLRDQDAYMKQKVSSQLDKLVGQGNYVVTVSTLLRETVKETLHESYDPDKTAISTKQTFNENLNSRSNSSSTTIGGPVSSTISKTLSGGGDSSNNKGYERTGSEVSYKNTKTQWIETSSPGMIEDISVAVTIDKTHFPRSLDEMELKRLIARSASPKVDPFNVTIAQADFKNSDASSTNAIQSSSDASDLELDAGLNWIPWAAGALVVCVLLILVLSMKGGKSPVMSPEMAETQRELEELKSIAQQQHQELQATKQQTQLLIQQQQQQQQLAQQQVAAITGGGETLTPQQMAPTEEKQLQQSQQSAQAISQSSNQGLALQETLDQLEDVVDDDSLDDDDLVLNLKHYIEES